MGTMIPLTIGSSPSGRRARSDGYNWRYSTVNNSSLSYTFGDVANSQYINKIVVRPFIKQDLVKDHYGLNCPRMYLYFGATQLGGRDTYWGSVDNYEITPSYEITDKTIIANLLSNKQINIEPFLSIRTAPTSSEPNGTIGAELSLYARGTIMEVFYDNATVATAPINTSSYTNQSISFSWQHYYDVGTTYQGFMIQVSKDKINWQTVADMATSSQYSYIMPANTLGDGLWYYRILCKTNIGNTPWSELQQFTLIGYPTINNLSQIGEYWEEETIVNWRSEYQGKYELELYQNNVKIGNTIAGATDKLYRIPPNTFTSKDNASVRVRVGSGTNWSEWSEIRLSLKDIVPTIENLTLSGSNVDLELIFSWTSTNQQKYEAEIIKDTTKNYTGTASKSISIAPSTLTTGLYKFRVRVAYKDRWTPWIELNATLTETLPSIGVLEPDGVIVERDNNILFWWTSNNQSKWQLVIDNNLTYTGTDTKALILAPATLQTGNHSMVLTVTYVTSANVEKKITKKAEFIVQGKPPIPTITNSDTFTTSRPILKWDTQDQQGYILELLKDNLVIYSTDWQNGLATQHKVMQYLENGTYTVRVKVINQYSLDSSWGTKTITVNAAESTGINLNVTTRENHVYLSWGNIAGTFKKFYIIRNGVVIAKTTDVIYTDYTAHSKCVYAVRGINDTDVYKDSNTVTIECNIAHGIMSTVGALEDTIEVGLSKNEFNFGGSILLEGTEIALSGRELPVVIFGEHSNNSYSINFVAKDLLKFVAMCRRRQTFLYRDSRQKLFLTVNNPNYSIDYFGIEYSIQALEVDYKEVISYD